MLIAEGTSLDLNTNGIPDECEAEVCSPNCAVPNDGEINVTDLLELIGQWGGSGSCDIDGSGVVNVTDLLAVIDAWGPCQKPCPPICEADTNDDCIVDVTDLLSVVNNWG